MAATLIAVLPSLATAQNLSFETFSLIGGDDLQISSKYRFHNVASGYDAIVIVEGISAGASLVQIDNASTPSNGNGFYSYFQPKVRGSATDNPYVDFSIQFVTTGTEDAVSLGFKRVAGMDIDGNNLEGNTYEYLMVNQLDAYRLDTNTVLDANLINAADRQLQFSSTFNGGPQGIQGITGDSTYMVELEYNNLSSMLVRMGSTGTRSTVDDRLYALNFYDTPIPFSSSTFTAVPEPSTLLLGACACLLVCNRRR
ncbi:MAG: hypothetical protein ABJQ29_09015 [Luteolibacter sp.]